MTKYRTILAGKAEDRSMKLAELASKVTDVLTDDALKVAMDIGEQDLATEEGVTALIDAMEEHVMQYKDDEARELFHAGTQVDGPLSRQHGESMSSYIARRRRWFQRLTELDAATKVSENILADYLLDCAGLPPDQKLMIRTVCGNRREFDEVATALRHQHPRIHVLESHRSKDDRAATWGNPKARFGRPPPAAHHRGNHTPFRKKWAYAAMTEEDADDGDREDDLEEELEGYACFSTVAAEEFETIEDQIEQDVVAAFAAAGADLDQAATADEVSGCVHDELFAFYSRENAQSRGVAVDRRVHSYRPKSELSIEERKKKVADAKANSYCRACGQKGHWASDLNCPARGKGSGKGKSFGKGGKQQQRAFPGKFRGKPTGMTAVVDRNGDDRLDDTTVSFADGVPPRSAFVDGVPPHSTTRDCDFDVGVPPRRTRVRTDGVPPRPPPPIVFMGTIEDSSDEDAGQVKMHVEVIDDVTEEEPGWSDDEMAQEISSEEIEEVVPPPPRPPASEAEKGENSEAPTFRFGQYRGKSFREVTDENASYYFWGKSEKKPGKFLVEYLLWVEKMYRVDVRMKKLTWEPRRRDQSPGKVVLPVSRRSKKQEMEASWATAPECDVCEEFVLTGSNAYKERKTCVKCGKVTVTKRVVQRAVDPSTGKYFDPETCPHENTNYRGSSRKTSRIFCFDCCTYVCEEPQSKEAVEA